MTEAEAEAQAQASQADTERRPTNEEIAQRAHELFLRRGATDGHEQEDWLQAERELMEEPKWLEDMSQAQRAHAVHWEHPWRVEVDRVEDEEAFVAFKASLEARDAKEQSHA